MKSHWLDRGYSEIHPCKCSIAETADPRSTIRVNGKGGRDDGSGGVYMLTGCLGFEGGGRWEGGQEDRQGCHEGHNLEMTPILSHAPPLPSTSPKHIIIPMVSTNECYTTPLAVMSLVAQGQAGSGIALVLFLFGGRLALIGYRSTNHSRRLNSLLNN